MTINCFTDTFAILPARIVQKVDNTIHRINHHPEDSVVCFVYTDSLNSDLSSAYHYPAFEQSRSQGPWNEVEMGPEA